tara:strand:+ start:18427 stop:18960 length:534 start_codon:yes stop_codon:yes gene_type:complete
MLENVIIELCKKSDKLYSIIEAKLSSEAKAIFGDDKFYWWLACVEGLSGYMIDSEGSIISIKSTPKKLKSTNSTKALYKPDQTKVNIDPAWALARVSINVKATPETHTLVFKDGDETNIRQENLELLEGVEDSSVSEEEVSRMISLRESGSTIKEIADELGRSVSTVYRYVKDVDKS